MRRRLLVALVILALGSAFAAPDERRCSICGTVIAESEPYFQVKGSKEVFCQRCYAEAPRCTLCKLPTAAKDIDPQTGACSRCLAKLPRCKACGKPIVGTVYKYSTASGVFCSECKNNRPACDICGAPVGDRHWDYPDGRIICSDCGDRAVFDVAAIKDIMRDAQETVVKRLGLKIKRPYTLNIEKLSGQVPSKPGDPEQHAAVGGGLYGKELGIYRLQGDRSEIVLLFGLPPDLIYETAAHEYAHAWQAENGLAELEPELLEGFAQYVAAEVLRAKGYRGALENLEARKDFPYGTGYQRIKAMNQRIIAELMRQKR